MAKITNDLGFIAGFGKIVLTGTNISCIKICRKFRAEELGVPRFLSSS